MVLVGSIHGLVILIKTLGHYIRTGDPIICLPIKKQFVICLLHTGRIKTAFWAMYFASVLNLGVVPRDADPHGSPTVEQQTFA